MKRKILVGLILMLLSLPAISYPFETPVKAGDIVLFEDDAFQLGGYSLWVPFFKLVCGLDTLPAHSELVIDDDGTTFSSIQGSGTTYSTVEHRQNQFSKSVLIRNPLLTQEQIEAVVAETYELDGGYNYDKYNALAIDFLLDFFFNYCKDENRWFTKIFDRQDNMDLVCSEATVLPFARNGITASIKRASV